MERSVDLVLVVARDDSDPTGAVLDLSVDGLVVLPNALFLRSLMRRASELLREPVATGEPAVRLSVNDSVVLGDAEGADFAASRAWAESVTESCGRVPNLVENRSNLDVMEDRSVTDGFRLAAPVSREVIRSPDERGCTVEAVGPFLVPPDGCRDLAPVLLRCEDSRSNSEPRDALLLPETLGADACGVGFGVLPAPIRLVPVRSGASIRCGGAYIRAVSMPGLDAILSVARGVRSAGADRLSIRWNIDPRLGALEAEGALTADDRLSVRGRGDGWNDRDEFGEGADGRELNDGRNDRDEFSDGADGRELNDGWNDRDRLADGADGRELKEGRNDRDEFAEGADGRELNEGRELSDPLRLDIRLVIELPRFPNDGLRATDRLGAGAALRDAGRDARAELAPRPRILPSADDPRSRTAPAAMFTTATRAPRLFSPAVAIFVLLSFPGVILNESEIPSGLAAGSPPFRITRYKLV